MNESHNCVENVVGKVVEIQSSSGKLQFEIGGSKKIASFNKSDVFIHRERCQVENISECLSVGDKFSFTAIKSQLSDDFMATCIWKAGKPQLDSIFDDFVSLLSLSKELSASKMLIGHVAKLAPPKCALVLVGGQPVILFVSSLKIGDNYLSRNSWIHEYLQVGDKLGLKLYKDQKCLFDFPLVSSAWKVSNAPTPAISQDSSSFQGDLFDSEISVASCHEFSNGKVFKGVTGRVKRHTSPLTGIALCVIFGVGIKAHFTRDMFCLMEGEQWDIKKLLPVGTVIYCHGETRVKKGRVQFIITCMWCGKRGNTIVPFRQLSLGECCTGIVCEKLSPSALFAMVVNVPVLIRKESSPDQEWNISVGSVVKLVVHKFRGDWVATLIRRSSPEASKKQDGKVIEVHDSGGLLEDVSAGDIVAFERTNTFLLGLPLKNVDLSKIFSPGDTLSFSTGPIQVWFGQRSMEDFTQQSREILEYCVARCVDKDTITRIQSELATFNLLQNHCDTLYLSDYDSEPEEDGLRLAAKEEVRPTTENYARLLPEDGVKLHAGEGEKLLADDDVRLATEDDTRLATENGVMLIAKLTADDDLSNTSEIGDRLVTGNGVKLAAGDGAKLTTEDGVRLAAGDDASEEGATGNGSELILDNDVRHTSEYGAMCASEIGNRLTTECANIPCNSISLQQRVENLYARMDSLQEGQCTSEEKSLLLDLVLYYMQRREGQLINRGTQTISTGPVMFTKLLPGRASS